jgi:disulfide bond formation protein DsbB
MEALLRGESVRFVRCDEAPWSLFGLSMAGWNALASLGLAALGVLAAQGGLRRRGLEAVHA